MSKDQVNQFDATAGNNTDIEGINTSETMLPSAVNNSIRSLMSLLKKQDVGTHAMTSPDIDGGTIDGTVIGGAVRAAGSFTDINVFPANGSTSTTAIDLGVGRSGNGYAFLDLIGDATYTDYGLRVIRNNTGANTTSSITHRGTGTFSLVAAEAAALAFYTTNAERIRLTSAGLLGLGTTAPLGTLSVLGNGRLVTIGDSGGANVPEIKATNTAGTGEAFLKISAYEHRIFTGGTQRLTINNSGNVGIGTTVPYTTTKLNVAGATSTNTTTYNATNPPAAGQLDIRSTDAYGTQRGGKLTFSGISGSAPSAVIQAVYGAIQGYKTNATINNSGGGLIFSTGVNATGVLTERIRISGEGLVGIGTTAPTARIDSTQNQAALSYLLDTNNTTHGGSSIWRMITRNIANSGTTSVEFYKPTGSGFNFLNNDTHASNFTAFGLGGVERMRITPTGVGIGLTAPLTDFVVDQGGNVSPATSGTMNTGVCIQAGAGSAALNIGVEAAGAWYNAGYSNNPGIGRHHRWLTGGGERMRILAGGNLLVNTTTEIQLGLYSESFPGTSKRGAVYNNTESFNGSNFISFADEGAIVGTIVQNGATTVLYSTASDYRLKNTITPMIGALAKVALLKPVTYKWNEDGSDAQGFIAHELQAVVPDCVSGEKDAVDAEGKPQYQGVDTSFLVATLTAAIQEQQALIEALTTRITTLEG